MSTVELRSFKKSYGAVDILHGVDLTIAEGEFVALVGPSGCGKSTMLRMIAGLEDITSGELLLDGKVVNTRSPKERNIAMVFQNYALYPHMSVRENIGLNLKIAGVGKAEVAERVTAVARLLSLEDLLDRQPSQLSGGQRQRVAMGRAIVRNPAAFLFDEPLSNLDAKLRVQMRTEIKALHAKVRTTSIYVTHDQVEAMTLADRVVVMNKGRIEQLGAPIDLYENPINMFVAGFIGSPSMNFLRGVAGGDGDAAWVDLGNGMRIDLGPHAKVTAGQPVVIGIRPEHLQIGAPGVQFEGIVDFVEPTGAQTHVTFTAKGLTLASVQNGNPALAAGRPVRMGCAVEQLYLFDGTTEARL
ncbi:sn-glycerol-3-phosphate ABC transporter ATP-binding protein UgpC [soil metagenome]